MTATMTDSLEGLRLQSARAKDAFDDALAAPIETDPARRAGQEAHRRELLEEMTTAMARYHEALLQVRR